MIHFTDGILLVCLVFFCAAVFFLNARVSALTSRVWRLEADKKSDDSNRPRVGETIDDYTARMSGADGTKR